MDHGFSAFVDELSKIAFEKRSKRTLQQLFEPDKDKARRRVDYHFSPTVGSDRWNKFVRNVESSEFVRQLARHPSAGDKLVTHAQSMHELVSGGTVGKVQSATTPGKTYEIKKVPGGFGCTCPDWRFVSSVKPKHECKHIGAHRAGKVRPD